MIRILPATPYATIEAYVAAGGGTGLAAARESSADAIIEMISASGLRGRGGAGFPTGTKWEAVASRASPLLHTSVVVNAAEGEPGTFKDRTILRTSPYAVIEGALIAARAVDAKSIVIATKASFSTELERLRSALAEVVAAGWCADVAISVIEGPAEYLFGEETAMLEVIDGRPPFPRIAPPYRHGVVEVVLSQADAESGSGQSAGVQMTDLDGQSTSPPVLVNNVETMANVAAILAHGAAAYREVGTAESPGSVVCTITGAVQRPGVVEVPMGTLLCDLIDLVGGVSPGRAVRAVLVGVSSAVVTAAELGTPLSYESMAQIGSGLGSAGFVVIADDVAPVSVAAGIAHFLAIESCGQCTHCKQDGADIAQLLGTIANGSGSQLDLDTLMARLDTVADGARCALAAQQQTVVSSLIDAFTEEIEARLVPGTSAAEPYPVAALVDLDEQGAVIDATFAGKQPDWTHDAVDSGKTPVDRFADHRSDAHRGSTGS